MKLLRSMIEHRPNGDSKIREWDLYKQSDEKKEIKSYKLAYL